MTPDEIVKSAKMAEDACMAYLAAALGLRPAVDLFRSVNPGITDGAIFDLGYPFTGELFTFPSNAQHFRAQIDLVSRDRYRIMAWQMMLMGALPVSAEYNADSHLRTHANVDVFRLAPDQSAFSEIVTAKVQPQPDATSVPVFTTTAKFDVVFILGDRKNAPVI